MNARARLQQATGLDLSETTVARALKRRMQDLAMDDRAAYEALLGGDELDALIELVVVPESWMFRDPEAFAVATAFLKERAGARTLRILSVPCAGGEEPYSMAMALEDAGVARDAYRIDAFDLSEVALARAREGCYTRNAFRAGALDFRERYFTPQERDYQIAPWLRQQVVFEQGNLLDMAAPAQPYDVVFCRNLLIYFDEPTVTAAIARLDALLAPDGLLFAGYAEVPAFARHGFHVLRTPGAFALQKRAPDAPPASLALPARGRAAPRRAAARESAHPTQHVQARRAPQPQPHSARNPAPPADTILSDLARLARQQADQGDLAAAGGTCEAILAADPQAADAYFILGMVSECAGDGAVAEQHYRRCIYLRPDHYEALCHLALLCEHQGDSAAAAGFRQRAGRVFTRRAGSPS